MLRSKRTREPSSDSDDVNIKSSESDDIHINIKSLYDIPSGTSSWEPEHLLALNIEYNNVQVIKDVITTYKDNIIDKDNPILLNGWAKVDFLTMNCIASVVNKKVRTIIKKIRNILINESTRPARETKIDSFVQSLLSYLGFDDDPFELNPQYDYSIELNNNKRITSRVEFITIKNDMFIILIVEDKHPLGVSELKDWSEPQIAGELLGAGFHNMQLSALDQKQIQYPMYINAIRVVGTKFTFYKAIITREYLAELQKCIDRDNILPSVHSMIIYRHPEQPSREINMSAILTAWDFCIPNDRKQIVNALKSLVNE